jgi:glycerol-3-phosphate acyltransferase PlsY
MIESGINVNPSVPGVGQVILVLVASYFLGCLTVAYYLVRWRTGNDLRTMGSGTLGAKNVKRMLGTWGSVVTFLGDFAKGLAAMALAIKANLPLWGITLAMLLVVAGHIWPLQLQFQGGKGISTSFGTIILYDRTALLCLVLLFLVGCVAWKRLTWSALMAYALMPFMVFFFHPHPVILIGLFLLAIEVLFAHRQNLREEYSRLRTRHRPPPDNLS